MPFISNARVQPRTGNITFITGSPATTDDATTAGVSSATTTLSGGSSGSSGSNVVDLQSMTLLHDSIVLTLPATVNAVAAGMLIAAQHNMLAVQVTATTLGPTQNYVLALYDDAPDTGSILYQATGITAASYTDNAAFFLAPRTGTIWAQITNIDADATTATVTVQYLALA